MGHRPRRNKARRMHIISRNSCCHSRRLNGLKPDHQSFYHLANTQYHVKSKVCGHYLRLNVLKVGSSQQAWCKDGSVDFVCLSNCTMLSVMPGTWPYPCQKMFSACDWFDIYVESTYVSSAGTFREQLFKHLATLYKAGESRRCQILCQVQTGSHTEATKTARC